MMLARLVLPLIGLLAIQATVDPPWSWPLLIALLVSMILHECWHVIAAVALGDSTAKDRGRLTVNPLVHLQFWFLAPIPIRFKILRFGRWGAVLVVLAGPAVNLVLGLLVLAPADSFLWHVGRLNLAVGIFNLLPIPPLDGATALQQVTR